MTMTSAWDQVLEVWNVHICHCFCFTLSLLYTVTCTAVKKQIGFSVSNFCYFELWIHGILGGIEVQWNRGAFWMSKKHSQRHGNVINRQCNIPGVQWHFPLIKICKYTLCLFLKDVGNSIIFVLLWPCLCIIKWRTILTSFITQKKIFWLPVLMLAHSFVAVR